MARWEAATTSSNHKTGKTRLHSRRIHISLLRSLKIFPLLVLVTWGQELTPTAVRNFGQVNEFLYRGAAPSDLALKQLSEIGIVRIIDLRETGGGTVHESALAASLHMTYINVPLRPRSAPTREQAQTILTLLSDSHGKTFVHCRRGKDRTGVVIACYRIQHDRWTNERAFDEAVQFGISRLQRSMRSFIVAFSPLPSGKPPTVLAPVAAQP